MLANARILGTLNQRFGPYSYWWQQDNAPAHQPAKISKGIDRQPLPVPGVAGK
jgi:hypothetical protein